MENKEKWKEKKETDPPFSHSLSLSLSLSLPRVGAKCDEQINRGGGRVTDEDDASLPRRPC